MLTIVTRVLYRRKSIMVPALILWLLGVPLVAVVLLFIFRVI